MTIEDKVKQALDEIRPILQQDGGDVSLEGVEGDTVFLRLMGACHGCPSAQATLKDIVEKKIRENCPEITKVVEVGGAVEQEPPPQAPDPFEGQKAIEGVKTILAVASGKGGVGKSTVAVNLALAMQANGKKVGLLDADIYGPSIPMMLGIDQQPKMDGDFVLPVEKNGLKVMSMGFFIEGDTPVVWRGPMIMKALDQLIRDVKWGELDCLVVDLPPGTGDAQLTLVQTVPVTGAVVVTTPSDVALIDARRAVVMFNQVQVPVIGIIENMSHFVCPHCHQETDVFSRGGGHAVADKLRVDFLGEIPLDPAIGGGGDKGRPVVSDEPNGPQAKAFAEISGKVEKTLGMAG